MLRVFLLNQRRMVYLAETRYLAFESCKILAELMKEQKTVVKKMEENENLSPVINCEHEDSVEI